MNNACQTLPDNTAVLQKIIKNQQAVILSLQTQLAALKRHRFGRSSENLDTQIEQLELMLDDMVGWVRQIDDLISPLSVALRKDVLSSNKLHGDDTTVPVLTPDLGKTKTGRLWVYVRDDRGYSSENKPAAFYCYSPRS